MVAGGLEVTETTDLRGEFRLGPLTASRVSIECTHRQYQPARAEVALDAVGDSPIRIVLEDRSVLVRGRLEGDEVGGVRLTWINETTRRGLTVTTAQDGSFDIGRINPGRYRITVADRSRAVEPSHATVAVDAGAPEQYFVIPLVRASSR